MAQKMAHSIFGCGDGCVSRFDLRNFGRAEEPERFDTSLLFVPRRVCLSKFPFSRRFSPRLTRLHQTLVSELIVTLCSSRYYLGLLRGGNCRRVSNRACQSRLTAESRQSSRFAGVFDRQAPSRLELNRSQASRFETQYTKGSKCGSFRAFAPLFFRLASSPSFSLRALRSRPA